ncbi:MAG TPA: helix-turn-helix domain-containing protein [Candidatus Norongarragalinales archaeon]|nr:helix-turn-helix domain-containing protein [Candidatus Norongarragalinales archaeon]
MWVARFKVWHPGSGGIELSKKYAVQVRIYLLNVFFEKRLGVAKVICVTGKDWKKFIAEWLRIEKHRMHFSRVEGNLLFYSYPQPKDNYASIALRKDVFFLRPILIRGGFEYWTLASFERDRLVEMPSIPKKIGSRAQMKLLSIRQQQPNLFMSAAAGMLSPNQLEAFEAAVETGYYEYPRRTDLETLAKRMHISKSTLREHLRRAEAKLMPAAANQISLR